MLRAEVTICSVRDLLLGFAIYEGADEYGEFVVYSFGILLFSFELYRYV